MTKLERLAELTTLIAAIKADNAVDCQEPQQTQVAASTGQWLADFRAMLSTQLS